MQIAVEMADVFDFEGLDAGTADWGSGSESREEMGHVNICCWRLVEHIRLVIWETLDYLANRRAAYLFREVWLAQKMDLQHCSRHTWIVASKV